MTNPERKGRRREAALKAARTRPGEAGGGRPRGVRVPARAGVLEPNPRPRAYHREAGSTAGLTS